MSGKTDFSCFEDVIIKMHSEEKLPAFQILLRLKELGKDSTEASIANFLKRKGFKSGKQYGIRKCVICKSDFKASGKNHQRCRVCIPTKEADARWGAHKITQQQFEAMLEKQNFSCAICLVKFASTSDIAVDHCHKTEKRRGLLCFSCNRALGWVEKEAWHESALRYLKETT